VCTHSVHLRSIWDYKTRCFPPRVDDRFPRGRKIFSAESLSFRQFVFGRLVRHTLHARDAHTRSSSGPRPFEIRRTQRFIFTRSTYGTRGTILRYYVIADNCTDGNVNASCLRVVRAPGGRVLFEIFGRPTSTLNEKNGNGRRAFFFCTPLNVTVLVTFPGEKKNESQINSRISNWVGNVRLKRD